MRSLSQISILLYGLTSLWKSSEALLPKAAPSLLKSHNQYQKSLFSTAVPDNESVSAKYGYLIEAIQHAKLDDTNAHRVFHGRGGMFPGCEHVTLDLFPPVCLLTSHSIEIAKEELEEIGAALELRWSHLMGNFNASPDLNWIYQHRPAGASPASTSLLKGQAPENHVVVENGMRFLIRLLQAQNHGLFLDMANGREWVRQHASDKNVLNLFAYTCAFSVAALTGGASQVVNIDMAKGPLKAGQQNHELNGLQEGARFLPHDIFKSWGKLRKYGPYDIIIADPPSYQRKSFVAKKDYAKLVRRLPDMLHSDGFAVLCLNAPELSSSWLQEQVSLAAPCLEFVERVDNPPTFTSKDAEKSLKVLIYRKKD